MAADHGRSLCLHYPRNGYGRPHNAGGEPPLSVAFSKTRHPSSRRAGRRRVIGKLARIAVELLELPLTAVILTWVAFEVGRWAQRRCHGSALMNPVLIAGALIIAVLEPCGI